MPEAAARIKPGMHVLQIMSLFTARTFASIVEAKRRQPGSGTSVVCLLAVRN